MGHAEVQQGDAHHGTGHITRVGMGTHREAGKRVVVTWGGMVGTPRSKTHREHGGGAGGGRELLALAVLGRKGWGWCDCIPSTVLGVTGGHTGSAGNGVAVSLVALG